MGLAGESLKSVEAETKVAEEQLALLDRSVPDESLAGVFVSVRVWQYCVSRRSHVMHVGGLAHRA